MTINVTFRQVTPRIRSEVRRLVLNLVNSKMTRGTPALATQGGDDPDVGREKYGVVVAPPKARRQVKRPPMYRVLLLNDDFTPMDFVVHILQKFFQKEYDEAMRIMLQVHQQGAGIAGTFSHEIAETKVTLVNEYAKSSKHPLKAIMEIA